MRLVSIIIFAVTSSLVSVGIAKPIPNLEAGGIAIPLTKHSSSNKVIDLDAMTYHGISVREKILHGLDNYEVNTGTMHPFAVKRNGSGLGRRGASLPLTTYRPDVWLAEISIGTPPKTFKVQIDTGSSDTWVLETGCRGISPGHNTWDPRLSESAEQQIWSFKLKYEDGTIVEGDLYTDKMTIGGFTAHPQTFGSAVTFKSQLQKNGHADGLLGLAFPSISDFGADPVFASLFRQGKLINPTFSLKLSYSGAEMYVGGVNSMQYKGDIAYTRLTNPPGMWEVSMDDVRINGHKILKNVPAIFDTGSNFIFGDRDRVAQLYKPLGGILEEHGNFGYYHLPCDSFPIVSFTFGGRSFEIPREVLILDEVEEDSPNCFGAIVADYSPIDPSETYSLEFWVMGMPFLEGVYSVFDYNNFRVGFADLA